ncbi:MAG: endopeptidase La [Planctomycetes bacterium]|nr:endopeptidase La [Planctomycetota bacterium]
MSKDDSLDDIDVVISDSEKSAVEEAARELLALPVVQDNALPSLAVVFPLRKSVPFPGLIMPVHAQQGYETDIMEKAMAQGKKVALLFAPGMPKGGVITKSSQFARVGVIADIHKRIRLPDGNTNYLCRGVRRFMLERFVRIKGVPVAKISYPEDVYPAGEETGALARNVMSLSQKVAEHQPNLGDDFNIAALNIDPAGNLADFAAAYLVNGVGEKQAIIEQLDVRERLRLVSEGLTRELVSLELGDRIQQEIREKIEEQQKEYFLREQISIIRRELGEEKAPEEADREMFLARLNENEYPKEVATKILDEVSRLSSIPTASPEYSVVRNYLDWLTELSWCNSSTDRINLKNAEDVLERDHYGLEEAKERILEFLGVRKMRPQHSGAILCLVGPPGVGKTSLAMAIAESMGRKLERMSLGGIRDEAEIKGHRRTYIGAMPGRLIQMIKRAGTNNPVIVLDEVDKLGKDFRGDPSSALLEVLDPAQNHAFSDLFLDVPFDLSKVMFVATANNLYDIPAPLRDRMEIIQLSGYLRTEKVKIAQRYLLPKQLSEHGLSATQLKLPVTTLRALIDGYTREAGVRGLEKSVASLCRKRTLELAKRRRPKPSIVKEGLEKYLGPAKFLDDRIRLSPPIGVALGLAYTSFGGDVLEIECVSYSGKGGVKTTGSLGKVMAESCNIAHSYLHANAESFGLIEADFSKIDLHMHFPAGATPKDGPSAGIAIASSMLSLLSGTKIKPKLAMTGEISLTGEVMPIGGVREKVLGAKMMGVKTVLLPTMNKSDVEQLRPEWKSGLKIKYVDNFKEVAHIALKI